MHVACFEVRLNPITVNNGNQESAKTLIYVIACGSLIVDSLCAVDNGGCSHFCLPSATSPLGYNCSCPDGFATESNTSCVCKFNTIPLDCVIMLCVAAAV